MKEKDTRSWKQKYKDTREEAEKNAHNTWIMKKLYAWLDKKYKQKKRGKY